MLSFSLLPVHAAMNFSLCSELPDVAVYVIDVLGIGFYSFFFSHWVPEVATVCYGVWCFVYKLQRIVSS